MAKYISFQAAIEALKNIFEDTKSDTLSINEIFLRTGRDLSQQELNKRWITNRLTDLKHYNLVKPIYAQTTPKTLEKVQLLAAGKEALGHNVNLKSQSRDITLESIAQDIREFQRRNPSISIEFAAKMKVEN